MWTGSTVAIRKTANEHQDQDELVRTSVSAGAVSPMGALPRCGTMFAGRSCGNQSRPAVPSVKEVTARSSPPGCGRAARSSASADRCTPPRRDERRPCMSAAARRPSLPADPRPDQRPRPGAAGDVRPDDRPPRPGVRDARPRGARGGQAGLRHRPAGGHLPVLRHRRLGGGAGQHALARRPRAGFETGHFAHAVAGRWPARLGLEVEFVPGDWRHGVDPAVRPRAARRGHRATRSRPCCVVHNETSTGVTSRIAEVRAGHRRAPATPRCCWSTPSPRWPRSTTATTSGASTSRSPARRRG